jgi:hypothetical protein
MRRSGGVVCRHFDDLDAVLESERRFRAAPFGAKQISRKSCFIFGCPESGTSGRFPEHRLGSRRVLSCPRASPRAAPACNQMTEGVYVFVQLRLQSRWCRHWQVRDRPKHLLPAHGLVLSPSRSRRAQVHCAALRGKEGPNSRSVHQDGTQRAFGYGPADQEAPGNRGRSRLVRTIAAPPGLEGSTQFRAVGMRRGRLRLRFPNPGRSKPHPGS